MIQRRTPIIVHYFLMTLVRNQASSILTGLQNTTITGSIIRADQISSTGSTICSLKTNMAMDINTVTNMDMDINFKTNMATETHTITGFHTISSVIILICTTLEAILGTCLDHMDQKDTTNMALHTTNMAMDITNMASDTTNMAMDTTNIAAYTTNMAIDIISMALDSTDMIADIISMVPDHLWKSC